MCIIRCILYKDIHFRSYFILSIVSIYMIFLYVMPYNQNMYHLFGELLQAASHLGIWIHQKIGRYIIQTAIKLGNGKSSIYR